MMILKLALIRRGLGFALKGVGISWAVFDGTLCQKFGGNNCGLLFLFVSIIFVICGYVLITLDYPERKKLKRKLKRKLSTKLGVKIK